MGCGSGFIGLSFAQALWQKGRNPMEPRRPARFSLRSRLKSFSHAGRGLRVLFVSEHNARLHAVAAILAVALSLWLELSRTEWALILFAIGGVIAAEAFNTAVESIVDLVSPEHHPLAGRAKDVAAGAVLAVAIGACAVGLLVWGPRLVARLP